MTSCALPANGMRKLCPVTPSHSNSKQAADIAALYSDCRLTVSSKGLRSQEMITLRIKRCAVRCVSTASNFGTSGSNERSSATRSLLIAVLQLLFDVFFLEQKAVALADDRAVHGGTAGRRHEHAADGAIIPVARVILVLHGDVVFRAFHVGSPIK